MTRLEKNNIFWQVLMWWGPWFIIVLSLSNGFDEPEKFLRRGIPSFIGVVIVVWVNIRYLLPRLFLQKKYALFVLSGLSLLAITVLLLHHNWMPWFEWFNPPHPSEIRGRRKIKGAMKGLRWMGQLTPLTIAFLGSTLVELARFAGKKEKEAIESEKDKLETELKFLKSQVNPHFLFNALNNIYSLSVVQAPHTSESIMQLSEILRYMVYDSNEVKVPLKSEMNYIKNFVDLKLLKDSRGMDVQISLDESAPNLMVAPLLFIPFVENAFKHSKIENLNDSYIRINLEASQDTILFSVINSIPENEFTKDEVGGVGLGNIRKRLELLYPDQQHELKIKQTPDRFEVVLKLIAG